MKKLVLNTFLVFSLAGTAISLNSCDRVKDAVEDISIPVPFAVKPDISEQKIPFASIPTAGYYPIPVTLNLDLDAEIKKQNSKLSINNLKSAKLESMNIMLVAHTLNAELDAVKSAKLYLKTPNLDKVLVATADGTQITKDKIEFTAVDSQLIDYFKSKENSLIIEMQGAKISLGEMTIKMNPAFRIAVGI